MKIGDRVKVKDQDITGTIVDYDCGNKVFVLDDYHEWATDDDGTLVFNISDLELEHVSKRRDNIKIEMSIFCNETDSLKWFDCAKNTQEFLEKLNNDELNQDGHYFRIKKEKQDEEV